MRRRKIEKRGKNKKDGERMTETNRGKCITGESVGFAPYSVK